MALPSHLMFNTESTAKVIITGLEKNSSKHQQISLSLHDTANLFKFEEDWENKKLNEPGRQKLEWQGSCQKFELHGKQCCKAVCSHFLFPTQNTGTDSSGFAAEGTFIFSLHVNSSLENQVLSFFA